MEPKGLALVRRPSNRLAEGLVTHIERTPVDVALARRQHEAYVSALVDAGWAIREVPVADDCPDSVFVEDTAVVCGSTAVLTRPGAVERRAELAGIEHALRDAGLDVVRIEPPGTLDGGDVLQVGKTVYVGFGARTNADGMRQLREHLAGLGRTVVPVPLGRVLHLKSAVTALPDGTFLAWPGLVDPALFAGLRPVPEESGCHVVLLGGKRLLIAASAPRTASMLADLGFAPVAVDISEFERLEGSVTCMSILCGVDTLGGCS
jgi:dimethylargininase